MKYYDELRNIEDQIARLDTIESLLRILSECDLIRGDTANIIWHLSDIVQDTNKNLSENFFDLWHKIKEEDDDYLDGLKSYAAHRRFDKILKPFLPKEEPEINITGC